MRADWPVSVIVVSVCLPSDALSLCVPGFSYLDVGYLFTAAPAKRTHCCLPWTWGSSSQLLLNLTAAPDGRVMVERADRMQSTGEGNGKPLQYACLENPMNSMKMQMLGH